MNGQERLQLEKSKTDSSRNFTFVLKRRVEESETDTKSQKKTIKQNFLRTKIQKKASKKKKPPEDGERNQKLIVFTDLA